MARKKIQQRQEMYYNPSANAYKYDVSAEEYYIQEPEQQTPPQPALRTKRKLRPIVAVMAAAVLGLTLGTVRVVQYERMSAANLRVNELRSTISAIEEEIETLNVKLEYAMDINTVQLIARDELGMDYPEHEQVVDTAFSAKPSVAARAAATDGTAQEESTASGISGAIPQYAAVPVSVPEEQGGE